MGMLPHTNSLLLTVFLKFWGPGCCPDPLRSRPAAVLSPLQILNRGLDLLCKFLRVSIFRRRRIGGHTADEAELENGLLHIVQIEGQIDGARCGAGLGVGLYDLAGPDPTAVQIGHLTLGQVFPWHSSPY